MARSRAGGGAGRPVPSELPAEERRRHAESAALRWLAARERSAADIRERLRDRGYDAETVTWVLDRLQTKGLQDDRRFAEQFASSSARRRGFAGRVIQQELRTRGIDKETAARAATLGPEEEMDNARRLAGKRWAQLATQPAEVRRRRVAGFLARRGYFADVVATVLSELERDDRDDPHGPDFRG